MVFGRWREMESCMCRPIFLTCIFSFRPSLPLLLLTSNKNITLRLVWDHMPLTGTLFMRSGLANSTILPDQYT